MVFQYVTTASYHIQLGSTFFYFPYGPQSYKQNVQRSKQNDKKSTMQYLSTEWSQLRLSFIELVSTTLYSIVEVPQEILLSSVHLIGHTSRLHPQTQKLKQPSTEAFHLNGHP